MCRHAGYIGPGIAATELLRDLPHSLYHQSFQARELTTGVVCADGYGVGWVDEDRSDMARYANGAPIWADPNLLSLGPSIRSHAMVAAVRNATVATSNTPEDAAPYCVGKYAWSLNGSISSFDEHWRHGPMVDWINPARRAEMKGRTDGEHLFAAWLSRMDAGLEPVEALQTVVRDVLQECEQHGMDAQLNILATDGEHLFATRCGTQPTQVSLYTLYDGEEFPGAWVVASEPLYDDPLWEPVAPDTVLALGRDAPAVRLSA